LVWNVCHDLRGKSPDAMRRLTAIRFLNFLRINP
jgi:hypothetical protein